MAAWDKAAALKSCLAMACLFLLVSRSAAETPRWDLRVALDDASYRSAVSKQAAGGLHVIDQAVYDAGDGTPLYAALWRDDGPAGELRWGLGADAFHRASIAVVDRGYRTADIAAGTIGGGPLYSGRWIAPNDRGHGTRYWQSPADFRRSIKKGQVGLLSIAPFIADGRLYIASAFETTQAEPPLAVIGVSERALRRIDIRYQARGYRLVQLRGWRQKKRVRYGAIWQSEKKCTPTPYSLRILQAATADLPQTLAHLRAETAVPEGFSVLQGMPSTLILWAIEVKPAGQDVSLSSRAAPPHKGILSESECR